ncbi:MAG: signal peptidase II [Treponema sp.]|jgi:signal peptidase II|nr:signal peptidase II [Treponema sp.]
MGFLWDRRKYILISLAVFFANYLLDRITKELAIYFLKGTAPARFFNDMIILVFVENSGAFLGLGGGWNLQIKKIVLLVLPIIICLGGLLYLMFVEKRLLRLTALVSIIGGGMGNLVDRLVNDFRVVDFMNFGIGPLRTGILNFADLSVTFGIIIWLISELWTNRERLKTSKKSF